MNKYEDKTIVFNRNDLPKSGTYTYIGRGSIWGNPVKIGDLTPYTESPKTMGREDVIIEYLNYFIAKRSLHKELHKLRNNDGVTCYCAPKACHGDILTAFADAYHKFNDLMLADGRKMPKARFNWPMPRIDDLPNPFLYYSDEHNLWQFSLGSNTDKYIINTEPNLYDAIRATLEAYFEACIKERIRSNLTVHIHMDEWDSAVEDFLHSITKHGFEICKRENGELKPVSMTVQEWLDLEK